MSCSTTCGLFQAGCSGYLDYYNQPRVPLRQPWLDGSRLISERKFATVVKPVMGCSSRRGIDIRLGCVSAASGGRGHFEMEYGDESLEEPPFWLSLIKDFVWAMKSFFSFLVDQPRQLRYIEWPTFSSTLKTATLTLVLVALLIVALATVDSGLCYLLALFLRRKP